MGIAFNGQDALIAVNGAKIKGAAFNGAKVYPPVISTHVMYAEPTPNGASGEVGLRPLPNNGVSGSITPAILGGTTREITWLNTTVYGSPDHFKVAMTGSFNGNWNTVSVVGTGVNVSYDRTSMSYGYNSTEWTSHWNYFSNSLQHFTAYETYTVTFT